MTLRALELFSGLGGWRHALGDLGEVAAAYDISHHANATYALNHDLGPRTRELATIPADALAAHRADLWMMSPPCQPFCRMGNRQGLSDPRSAAFLHLLELLPLLPPDHLVLENVAGFLGSEAHTLLEDVLERLGLHRLAYSLDPTAFGIPNLRPRVYLLASRRPLARRPPPALAPGPLAPFLDPDPDPGLCLSPEEIARHGPGLDLVDPSHRRSACFIGGYGQRFVGSGSFLQTPTGIRRFSPTEIARLMGLPDTFRFPDTVPLGVRYKLLGNGLSIPVARWVVEQLG